MEKFETGAVRDIGGKGRMDLLPWCAIRRLSMHMEKGSKDHGERNWEKGIPMHCFLDSAFRHLSKYMDGYIDEDHLCAAAWNIVCAMWTEENKPEMMDIPTRKIINEMVEDCKYYHQKDNGSGVCWATTPSDKDSIPCPYDGDCSNCSIPTR